MRRSWLLLSFFALAVLVAGAAQAAEHQIGNSCLTDANSADWDTIARCISGTYARSPYFFGTTSDTCDGTIAGLTRYNSGALELCNGSSWINAGNGATLALGSTATGANPQRSGDATTGLFSPTASTVAITTAGTEALRVTATGSVGIGTTAPKTSLDLSSKTDALLLQTATAAAGASCTGYTGGIRYNSNLNYIEFCNGTTWRAFVASQDTVPPTAPSGAGYFVVTNTTWDGNLGGLSGADSKCLTELGTTHTDWNGYSDANSRGLLNSSHVKAFICTPTCNNLMPLTTYYFAAAGNSGAGGAYFVTDASGYGPQDSANWSAANRFSGTYTYWADRNVGTSTLWGEWAQNNPNFTCLGFTSNSSGYSSYYGSSGSTTNTRWNVGSLQACNLTANLICFVNP